MGEKCDCSFKDQPSRSTLVYCTCYSCALIGVIRDCWQHYGRAHFQFFLQIKWQLSRLNCFPCLILSRVWLFYIDMTAFSDFSNHLWVRLFKSRKNDSQSYKMRTQIGRILNVCLMLQNGFISPEDLAVIVLLPFWTVQFSIPIFKCSTVSICVLQKVKSRWKLNTDWHHLLKTIHWLWWFIWH